MRLPLSRIALVLAGSLAATGVQAQDAGGAEPIERIRSTAASFVAAQAPASARVEAGALDSRLRLPACPQPLKASAPNGSNRGLWSVAVLCELGAGAGPLWSIFVPVRVADIRPVLVLVRPLAPGQTVTADAVALEPRDLSSLSYGYLVDPVQAIGQKLRRPLAPGAVLSPDTLAAPTLIKRGAVITIIGRSGSLEVRAQGKALADGGGGERISVENLSSHRVVDAVVRDGGNVEVGL